VFFNNPAMKRLLLSLTLFAALFAAPFVHAAEGMWTYDNLPLDAIQKASGFRPTPAWTQHVMQSSARLAGGCSGSFVSKDGLVLTNHHCVNSCVQELSSAQNDYIKTGFLAKKREEEQRCPATEINRLDSITDVTALVNKATAGKSGEAFSKAQKAEKSRIEAECADKDKAKSRCEVVELYQGGAYHLYQYKRFQDVRLAFAPELAIAFFGGDPDNFNFPRFDLDMALLRVYEDGKPATVQHFFPFSKSGAEEGQLVFTSGHPGSTQRGLTTAQLAFLRDFALPQRLFVASELRGLLNQYRSQGSEQNRVAQSDLFGVENSIKARKGQLEALQDPAVFAYKQKQEAELKAFIAKSPKLKANVGTAYQDIEAAQTVLKSMYWQYRMIELGQGLDSEYFDFARTLVRGASEKTKPNGERLREYTEAALPQLEQSLFSTAPIYPDYEKVKLTFALTKLRELLGVDHALVKKILGKESPEAVAERLVKGATLAEVETRKKLWNDPALLAASTDPFIVLARAIDGEARALRSRYETEVEAVQNKAAEKIAAARFAMKGTSIYPDATFTLRLSYGVIKGWQGLNGAIAPFTKIAGAFERHTGFDPFALPESWLKAQGRLNGEQRFNQVSTNDIIGGNSGSPLINASTEIVGLVFDGNILSLGGAYWFDERVNRTVSVHSGAILEALANIYGASHLVDELKGR
jgi:V8-like Glu-specific endopeptidase